MLPHIIEKLESAEIIDRPFPHAVIDGFLPEDQYRAVLAALPPTDDMVKVEYSGTGHGRRGPNYHDYGYDYPRFQDATGPLGDLRAAFADPEFSRALLRKFETEIPAEKHASFVGNDDYTTEFDIRVDLPGYAIPPHADLPEKIITFMLYLSPDDRLAEMGTMLCEPRDHRWKRGRGRLARRAADILERMPHESQPYQRLVKTRLGLRLGVGQGGWLPWSWFRVAERVAALPNRFIVFAPCERSFHAVDLDGFEGERPVVRGFIRSGDRNQLWTRPHRPTTISLRSWGSAARRLVRR